MGIIEQAAKRLEELKRSGVAIPVTPPMTRPAPAATGPAVGESQALNKFRTMRAGGPSPFADPANASQAAGQFADARHSREVKLDIAALGNAGYIVPSAFRSQLAEEFRAVKRPLIANAKGQSAAPIKRANLIMVTSSLPGEGKTFTSINLAMSIAMELDRTVLLVDADPIRPAVMGRLGVPTGPGLLDRILDPGRDLSEFLLKTDVERLWLMPVGSPHAQATELLASTAMDLLLDEMATRYADRIIIFDGPPLLATSESRVLATRMGQVVMVVEAGKTTMSTVQEALRTIEACPVVLPLLNKSRGAAGEVPYGYYGN